MRSALPLCDEFIIGCGDSTDGTTEICARLAQAHPDKVRVIHSVWQRENQSGGFQLKHQTDLAQAECRGDWCVYLQADELFHEEDFPEIRAAMRAADRIPEADGLVFDYLHFYGNFSYFITGRNWYRREVRAFKNHRGIAAFRDAQGFRRDGRRLKVLPANGRVFHYGYVRSPQSLQKKSSEMSQWWGEKAPAQAEAFQLRRHVGLRKFTGTHPEALKKRVGDNAHYVDPAGCRRVWNGDEIKNALTFAWESVVPYRIGEFRNYEVLR